MTETTRYNRGYVRPLHDSAKLACELYILPDDQINDDEMYLNTYQNLAEAQMILDRYLATPKGETVDLMYGRDIIRA